MFFVGKQCKASLPAGRGRTPPTNPHPRAHSLECSGWSASSRVEAAHGASELDEVHPATCLEEASTQRGEKRLAGRPEDSKESLGCQLTEFRVYPEDVCLKQRNRVLRFAHRRDLSGFTWKADPRETKLVKRLLHPAAPKEAQVRTSSKGVQRKLQMLPMQEQQVPNSLEGEGTAQWVWLFDSSPGPQVPGPGGQAGTHEPTRTEAGTPRAEQRLKPLSPSAAEPGWDLGLLTVSRALPSATLPLPWAFLCWKVLEGGCDMHPRRECEASGKQ